MKNTFRLLALATAISLAGSATLAAAQEPVRPGDARVRPGPRAGNAAGGAAAAPSAAAPTVLPILALGGMSMLVALAASGGKARPRSPQ